MRRNSIAAGCVVLGLVLGLWYVLDDVVALGVRVGHVIWPLFMIACAIEWFRLRRRDPTETVDRLGIMIGVLMWALGWALGT